jgi:hypothetical protein
MIEAGERTYLVLQQQGAEPHEVAYAIFTAMTHTMYEGNVAFELEGSPGQLFKVTEP